MERKFKLMTIESVVDMLQGADVKFERMIVRERFAMNLDMEKSRANSVLLSQIRTPFRIQDNRVMRLVSGSARAEINFQEYELVAGDIVIVKENSYFEIHEISDDAQGEVMVFMPEKYQTNLSYSRQNFIKLHPSQAQWDEISHLIYTIYSFARQEPYRKEVVEPLVCSLINYMMGITRVEPVVSLLSGQELLFNRFIEELNDCKTGKQPVNYYAERLCVTPQYLSRAVSHVSGNTVSQWINKAVITKARIYLQNTSNSIAEISETLNFPSDSFFCRFFKRETGMTPTAYRKLTAAGVVYSETDFSTPGVV